MYKAQTRGISVTVMPRFVEEESSPAESRYFFAYTVEIVNNGSEQVQLRSRHWRIIDGHGACQEVRGTGVFWAIELVSDAAARTPASSVSPVVTPRP